MYLEMNCETGISFEWAQLRYDQCLDKYPVCVNLQFNYETR